MINDVSIVERRKIICTLRPVYRNEETMALANSIIKKKPFTAFRSRMCLLTFTGMVTSLCSRKLKEEKCAPLANELRRTYGFIIVKGHCCCLPGFLVPEKRQSFLVSASKKYLQMMRKLIVSDTLRSLRNMYTEFITGVRKVDQQFGSAGHNSGAQNIPVANNVPLNYAVIAPVLSVENNIAE